MGGDCKGGVLLVTAHGGEGLEDQVTRWLDEEHVPECLAIPGVRQAQRFTLEDGDRPQHLTLFDLDDLSVLARPEYQRLSDLRAPRGSQGVHLERVACELIFQRPEDIVGYPPQGRYLLVVMFNVPEPMEDEFNDWYNTEHIPLLLEVPGWIRARRFVARGGPFKYVAIHELADTAVFSQAAYLRARNTPWRQRIVRHRTGYGRGLYRLLYCRDGQAAPD